MENSAKECSGGLERQTHRGEGSSCSLVSETTLPQAPFRALAGVCTHPLQSLSSSPLPVTVLPLPCVDWTKHGFFYWHPFLYFEMGESHFVAQAGPKVVVDFHS